MSLGILHPTVVTELIVAAGLSTLSQEILQSWRAIERIMRAEEGEEGAGAVSSRGDRGGASSSSRPARPTQTKATLADLARVTDKQEVEMQGLKYWLQQKMAYEHSVYQALGARLEQISLRCDMNSSTFPLMLLFPDQLSQPSVPVEPPYQEDDEEDEE